MKLILKNALYAGVTIFIISYGGLISAIYFLPDFFVDYISPAFNSDGSRDVYFFLHPFVLSIALSIFWEKFKEMVVGSIFLRGLKFGFIYAGIALIPIMWITYSAVDVTFVMVFSWLLYGFMQSCIAGIIFAKFNP